MDGNDVEEGLTDEEGEDSLDLSNVFDEVPQDTDEIIDTIDAFDQHLFTPVTPSPIADRSTEKVSSPVTTQGNKKTGAWSPESGIF